MQQQIGSERAFGHPVSFLKMIKTEIICSPNINTCKVQAIKLKAKAFDVL